MHVKSEDYGISHTCYPYTPILILLPPKFQPYPTSRADIVELRNCFAVESQSKLSERDHHWYHGCSFPRGYTQITLNLAE